MKIELPLSGEGKIIDLPIETKKVFVALDGEDLELYAIDPSGMQREG